MHIPQIAYNTKCKFKVEHVCFCYINNCQNKFEEKNTWVMSLNTAD